MRKVLNSLKMVTKKARKQAQILEIALSSTSKPRVLRFVRGKLGNFDKKGPQKRKFLIVTPNPEIVMRTQKDKELANIINSADFSLPDGVGLAAAYKFMFLPAPQNKILRIPVLLIEGMIVGFSILFYPKWLTKDLQIIKGRDFFLELCKLANKKTWRVFLLGGKYNVSERTAKNLQKSLKRVDIASADGPNLDKEVNPATKSDVLIEKDVVRSINKFRPHLLFVAFGSPKQEKWLNKWLEELDIGGAMVVGGTFDYMARRRVLPPKWMENLGLEWVWRLITQPERTKRILKAFPLFPIKVFWHKLSS